MKARRKSSPDPFFLFVNLMDVHGPYLPLATPGGCSRPARFPDRDLAIPECGWRTLRKREKRPLDERPAAQTSRRSRVDGRLGDLYDDCLLGLDAELGRFLATCERSGRLANTWVVITADHGEHFGEHNQFGHGSSLYNEMTHVPSDLDSAAQGRRAPIPASPHVCEGAASACPYPSATCRGRSPSLLDPAAANPFPGRSLERLLERRRLPRCPPDPVLSQLEEPRLRGESFRTENVIKLDSIDHRRSYSD